jgi:hypothetical protein
MAELTFPVDEQSAAQSARFTNRGCISCPTGHSFTSDEALGTLERVTNQVLLNGWKDFAGPQFPLAKVPVRAASSQQMTGLSSVKHSAGYSRVQRLKHLDPTPQLDTFNVSHELIERCGGNLALATMLANTNSIGCAPPFGQTGFTGKRRYYRQAFTNVLNLGPFCVTNFLDHQDFRSGMDAYQRAAIKASALATEYEKMRRFVDMSTRNGAAVAGTTSPRFGAANFQDVPDSPGSFEWLINAIERGLGGEISRMEPVTVTVSQQILEYWVKKYVADNGNEVNLQQQIDWSNLMVNAQGYQGQFSGGKFTLVSKRTNRKIHIEVNDVTPVYVEVTKTGAAIGEWAFQDFYLEELGDDPEAGQGAGVFQTFNPYYGDPESCEGTEKRLCELIMIHTGKAFHYEAFPTNPLGWAMGDVETNMANLWGSTQIQWFTGCEVDLYFLSKINEGLAGTGAPCLNNRDNTWFAGVIKNGLQVVEDEPREMMALLVAVPGYQTPLEATEVITSVEPAAAVVIGAQPGLDPVICKAFDTEAEPDVETAGRFVAPERLNFNLTSEDRTVTVVLQRVGGTNGTLTIPFTVTDGTATEGSAPTNHFELANGNIVFADGESTTTLDIDLRSIERGDTDPTHVTASIVYDNSPVVIINGGFTTTELKLKLHVAP